MVILRFLSIFSVFAICPTPAGLHGSMRCQAAWLPGFVVQAASHALREKHMRGRMGRGQYFYSSARGQVGLMFCPQWEKGFFYRA